MGTVASSNYRSRADGRDCRSPRNPSPHHTSSTRLNARFLFVAAQHGFSLALAKGTVLCPRPVSRSAAPSSLACPALPPRESPRPACESPSDPPRSTAHAARPCCLPDTAAASSRESAPYPSLAPAPTPTSTAPAYIPSSSPTPSPHRPVSHSLSARLRQIVGSSVSNPLRPGLPVSESRRSGIHVQAGYTAQT